MAQQLSAGEGTVTVGQSDETVSFPGTVSLAGTVNVGGASSSVGFFGATATTRTALTTLGALTAGETTPEDIAAALVTLVTELATLGVIKTA